MAAIFISYRREDSAGYAGRLHEELEERLGAQQVFRDVDTLRAGQDFEDAIRQRLSQCGACIVMIGPGWLRSQTASGERRLDQPGDYVVMEITAALARPDVLVVPVLVGGATMPAAADLPEAIRPLVRRQAFTARDETWEADMDRLASLFGADAGRAPGRSLRPPATARLSRYLWMAALAAVALIFLLFVGWMFRTGTAGGSSSRGTTTGGATDADAAEAGPAGRAYAIDIPASGVEVAHGELIYTPLAGSVQPRGATTRVWLRLRVSNASFYDANLWDDSFRLAVGSTVVAPNSGLNEILEKQSIRQVVVRFDVPGHPATGTLRITYQGKTGEIPLDLTSNGRPAAHDQADESDSLSRATVTTIVRDARPLLDAEGISVTLLGIVNRHFVNTQKVVVRVRWMNTGRYQVATWDLVLRLAAGGETLAPSKQPSDGVAAGASYLGDVIFDVPPALRQGLLTATLRGKTRELPLTLK